MQRKSRVAGFALVGVVALITGTRAQNLAFSLFERYVEPLRVQAGIPGLSAAILQDGQVVWERGFGQADVEGAIAARPDTPYHVADLTQVVTTHMLARCAEQGRVRADDAIRTWLPLAPDPPATIRQILSHSSGLTGGFRYDLSRFALLTRVVEWCTDEPYQRAVAEDILDFAAMIDAVPGRDFAVLQDGGEPMFEAARVERYRTVLQRLATPYKVDKRGRTRGEVSTPAINAASGLIASVRDLAKFDGALDIIIRPDSLAQLFTNSVANGVVLPTALGWFAQAYEGERLVWQFSLVPDAYSGLILKIPSRRLTLILLANSDGLSVPFSLHEGDVTTSLFARAFLKLFL